MNPVVRNLRFEIDESVPQYWLAGRKSVTIFLDNLSVFFPAGERFFVRAVRAHQPFVKEDGLMQEVRAFCGQEGVHGREHERYNELLRRNYPIEAMERRVQAILDRVTRRAPDLGQLGVTCALEHFTALLGGMLLRDPRLLEGAHPAMQALWRWHAAEENEHKTVAYDVYRAAGGAYPMRVWTMIGATAIFWAKVIEQQARMMHESDILFSASEWAALGRYLFVEPGGMVPLLRHYFEYYRPDFHPSQIDSNELLDQWRAEYDASPVYAMSAAAARSGARGRGTSGVVPAT
ncbi:MAG TPA: metal-dependent hydrolase [Polyangiaceae bacterium]|jgi:predicted metal-dependent hydrolase|nr:metal-dependent hydrolase [Polyangiaceae bacterium]